MSMQIGAFELLEPLPELKQPRLLVALQPWVDVGSVGTMALTFLEEQWQGHPLAQLRKPGTFYDFTRYRPLTRLEEGQRVISVPNTFLRYAHQGEGQDWLFLHALEPHSHSEEYVDSLLELLKRFDVRQYGLIGSMYAPVPHTRPLLASGSASNEALRQRLRQLGVKESGYQGPTSILSLVSLEAQRRGIETLGLILQLPTYVQLEQDYRGLHTLLGLLSKLYDLPLDLDKLRADGDRQYLELGDSVRQDPRLARWVQELETLYDTEEAAAVPPEEAAPLSPELEQFLQDIQRRWNEPETPS